MGTPFSLFSSTSDRPRLRSHQISDCRRAEQKFGAGGDPVEGSAHPPAINAGHWSGPCTSGHFDRHRRSAIHPAIDRSSPHQGLMLALDVALRPAASAAAGAPGVAGVGEEGRQWHRRQWRGRGLQGRWGLPEQGRGQGRRRFPPPSPPFSRMLARLLISMISRFLWELQCS